MATFDPSKLKSSTAVVETPDGAAAPADGNAVTKAITTPDGMAQPAVGPTGTSDLNPTEVVTHSSDAQGNEIEIKTTPAPEPATLATDFDFQIPGIDESPRNPKAVEFGTKKVNVNGRELRMPATTVNAFDAEEYTDQGFLKPIAAFKHHAVKRFQVGRHTFQNHILQIFNEADLEDFLSCWEGLQGPDQVNITQYDWEAAARVHTSVSDMLVSRGSMQTNTIKDPKKVA